MTHIVCGKFDNAIDLSLAQNMQVKKIRIGSKNPNKLVQINYRPISTDGTFIYGWDGKVEVRTFLSNFTKMKSPELMVLTVRERELILDVLADFDLDVSVFELKFPIYKETKYISNLYQNFTNLCDRLKKMKSLGVYNGGLMRQLSRKYLYKVERKLRFKNNLDQFFGFAYKGGYQEVFKLSEERPGRVVIALDYNSMFVDCMKGEFLEPKSIRYISRREIDENRALSHGLYRVTLKNSQKSFFQQFHPFRFVKHTKSSYFSLDPLQNVETLLFKNEIDYYKQFFESIEIHEGFTSDKTINHPLYNYSLKKYEKRLKYKVSGNYLLEALKKIQLVTTHSSTNQLKKKHITFFSLENLKEYLTEKYMIKFNRNEPVHNPLETLLRNKNFEIKEKNKEFRLSVVDFNHKDCVYSLSAQVLANARLKMIKLIESLIIQPSVEMCYSNIDSVHVSIERTHLKQFLSYNSNIISDKLGDLKVQKIGDRGYWLDIGRYWIYKNGKVCAFKNIGFNHAGNENPFLKNRKSIIHYKSQLFNYVKRYYSHINDAFSFTKKLDSSNVKVWRKTPSHNNTIH